MAKLRVTGEGREWEVSVPREGAVIGRDAGSDVRLDDQRVSGRHARLISDPSGRWTIDDLASKNGVWVGQRRVTSHTLLWGEEVVVGPFGALFLGEGCGVLLESIFRDDFNLGCVFHV